MTGKMMVKAAIAALALSVMGGAAMAGWDDFRPKDKYVDEAPRKYGRKKAPYRGEYRFILVESHFHPRSVVVPVREAPLGKQVKLPDGGSWVYCEITCEYTVRRMSLDFWEGQGQGFTSPGYIHRDFYLR